MTFGTNTATEAGKMTWCFTVTTDARGQLPATCGTVAPNQTGDTVTSLTIVTSIAFFGLDPTTTGKQMKDNKHESGGLPIPAFTAMLLPLLFLMAAGELVFSSIAVAGLTGLMILSNLKPRNK